MQGSPLTRSVARFMVYFSKKDSIKEQQPIVIEWIKYAGNIANANKQMYLLPQLCGDDDDIIECLDTAAPDIPKVCYSALLTVLGRGRKFWNTCKRHAAAGTLPEHGLTGRPSNRPVDKELRESLHRFFNEIASFAEPRATRFTREITGQLDIRDEDNDTDYLPPNFKKRALYGRFCWERGWSIETSASGVTNRKEREDEQWIALQRERKPICSWIAFWRMWQQDFPKLKISSPAADICGECHKFNNRMKSSNTEGEKRTSLDPGLFNCEFVPDSTTAEYEKAICEAHKHVRASRVMRTFANTKMTEALADEQKEVEWAKRRDCVVADYCQNMELPFFGEAQPGETYYFSPRLVYCFGVANVGLPRHKLNAYIYLEGEGKKGGNNVASLLHKEFTSQGWLDLDRSQGPRAELSIIVDNCAGQNKNKMVLRYALILVELGYYKEVNIIFLVAGHTKNACDRLFNALKSKYRESDIFSADKLIEVLSVAKDV